MLSILLFALTIPLTAEPTLNDRQAALQAPTLPSTEGLPEEGPSFLITTAEARAALYSHRVRIYYEKTLIPQYDLLVTDSITLIQQRDREIHTWKGATLIAGGLLAVAILVVVIP